MRVLLDRGASVDGEVSRARSAEDGEATSASERPLHVASRVGSLRAVKLLVARGASVESTSSVGDTPLHVAALGGQLDIVEEILKHDVDVNATNQDGVSGAQRCLPPPTLP